VVSATPVEEREPGTFPPRRRRAAALAALVGLIAALALPAAALGAQLGPNLVVNGSFERPNAGPAFITFFHGQSFAGWDVLEGSIDVTGPEWQSASGTQAIDLTGGEAGTIRQKIQTAAGARYRLSFQFAGNPECGDGVKEFVVLWGGKQIADLTFDTTGHTNQDMGWEIYKDTVYGNGGARPLVFRSLAVNTFCGPMLDAVRVMQVLGG